MSWYKEGAVNIEHDSKTVTGVGTKWANPLIGVCAGQMLILKTANTIEICEIASVQSDTQLTLVNKYDGETKTGANYEIPTVPKVSIEALALRISEMLNYYQLQMNGWQSILTGSGDITLTAPDGRVVTIKSQRALTETINNTIKSQNELTKTINDAIDSQNKLTETVNNTIKKTGEENQSIDGSLDVKKLTENGVRVYSPNNKPSTDDIGALAVTKTIVNGKTEYQTDNLLNFKVRPKFNNSDLISKSDFSVKLGNPGFEIMPSGLIRQWGVVTLPAVGNYHSVKIDSITYYTNYYRILLPIAFPTRGDSVNVTFNCGTFNNQYTMFGLSATANLDGSPTSFTVAVLSSVLGYVPAIHYEIIGH